MRDDSSYIRCEKIDFVLRWRWLVADTRQDSPNTAVCFPNFSHGVDNLAVFHEDDVAVFSHEFKGERLCDNAPTFT